MSAPEITPIGKSDHMGLLVTKSTKEIRTAPRTTLKRVYKNFDKDNFVNDIREAKERGKFNWVLTSEDENDAFAKFCASYVHILNKHAPLKVIQNRTHYVPYLNEELRSLILLRNAAKCKAIEEGSNEAYNEYKTIRNEVSTKMKTAEARYYQSKFNDPEASTGTLWRNAYQALGSVRSTFPSQILVAGKVVSKPIDMANEVNKFFIQKIKNIKENLRDTNDTNDPLIALKKFLTKRNVPAEGFKIKEVTEEELKKILKKMNGKKACGLDWICGYSLKLVGQILEQEIRHVINLTIRNKSYVNVWKCAKVHPGFKNKGNKSELKFYRPISNLNEISKIAERCVYNQMYEYLDKNNLIHPSHHGFLKNCSPSTALQQIYDIWMKQLRGA